MIHRSGLEHRPNQTRRLVNFLRSRNGQWVPLPEILAMHISHYSARVWEARHRWGLNIENRTKTINGERHSWFRLVETTALTTPRVPSSLIGRNKAPSTAQTELFQRDELERCSRWEDVG